MDTGQYSCYQSIEGDVQIEQEQDREEIKGRMSAMEATGSHWGRLTTAQIISFSFDTSLSSL